MVYSEPLPTVGETERLAQLAEFPVSSRTIAQIARGQGFDRRMLGFLELFPAGEKFDSRDDFLARSEEIILLVREQHEMPEETVLSQQD